MPYKHNENRRHKIKKSRYKVTNWLDYNNGLRQRGDVTIWFAEEAIADWRPAKTGARGRPQEYSDIAIEAAVLIRQAFYLPLRQTEGFMNSLARIKKTDNTIPDFSSISKRGITLPRHILTKAMEPGSIDIADSTGLKVYGKDEWHQEKHNVSAWRKLQLAIDENHQVLACELTTPDVGDPTAVPDLSAQIDTPSGLSPVTASTMASPFPELFWTSNRMPSGHYTAQERSLSWRWRYTARPAYSSH